MEKPEQRFTRKIKKRGRYPVRPKHVWTQAEDLALQRLVEKVGPSKWGLIACHLPGRYGKQCRERWFNHLCPGVVKDSWAEEEEWNLFLLHQVFGSKWAVFAHLLAGRTDNTIKNHFNSIMRKKTPIYEQKLIERLKNGQLWNQENTLERLLLTRIQSGQTAEHGEVKGPKRNYTQFFSDNSLKEFVTDQTLRTNKPHSNQNVSTNSLDILEEESELKKIIFTPIKPCMTIEQSCFKEAQTGSRFATDSDPKLKNREESSNPVEFFHSTPQRFFYESEFEVSIKKVFNYSHEKVLEPIDFLDFEQLQDNFSYNLKAELDFQPRLSMQWD